VEERVEREGCPSHRPEGHPSSIGAAPP